MGAVCTWAGRSVPGSRTAIGRGSVAVPLAENLQLAPRQVLHGVVVPPEPEAGIRVTGGVADGVLEADGHAGAALVRAVGPVLLQRTADDELARGDAGDGSEVDRRIQPDP